MLGFCTSTGLMIAYRTFSINRDSNDDVIFKQYARVVGHVIVTYEESITHMPL
jgi:hypothetical protein